MFFFYLRQLHRVEDVVGTLKGLNGLKVRDTGDLRVWHPEVWHPMAVLYAAATAVIIYHIFRFALAPVQRPHQH